MGNRSAENKYKCKCGSDKFFLVDKKVGYPRDIRIEPILVCAKCGKNHDICPCNTNGLIE